MPKIRMMELFDDAKEKINAFIEENSKLTATVIAVFVLLVFGGIFALVFGGKVRKTKSLLTEDFTKREEFFTPQQASLTDDYYFSRVTGEKWSNEERDRWFTIPDESNLKKLGEANDALTDKILEAAP